MTVQLPKTIHRIAWFAALIALLAWGFPMFKIYMLGGTIRDYPVPSYFFIPYAIFGALMLVAMASKFRPAIFWTIIWSELAAVSAMAVILPWAGISHFLVIIAWQVAVATTPRKALGWCLLQTAVFIGAQAQAITPDLCWVIVKSLALQLLLLFLARALQRQEETSQALAKTNSDLRAAQAIIVSAARDAERLRISRELHDAWGHELTALGLQLEIASNVVEPGRANEHVAKAKGLARNLLSKVRDVVSTLREEERSDLRDALMALAQSVPTPAIHVEIAQDVQVLPDQAHALIRCAQEAVTNSVKHAKADNLWLQVSSDGQGIRLVARDDGQARISNASPGSGLLGLRERLENLGGRLSVRSGAGAGFTIDAWLPTVTPQPA